MMRQQEVQQFLTAALECSVYVAPKDPGLTHAELFEAGGRVGYQEGELGDALRGVAAQMYFGDSRLMPRAGFTWSQFNIPEEPDYRKSKRSTLCARSSRRRCDQWGPLMPNSIVPSSSPGRSQRSSRSTMLTSL